MTETLTPPPSESEFTDYAALHKESQEAQDSPEEVGNLVEKKLLELDKMIGEIKAAHPVAETGGNSFYDVTGNLLSIAKPSMRYWKEDGEPEDLAFARESVDLLDRYMSAIQTHPDALQGELTARDGAFPELRQLADKQYAEGSGKQAIPYYVEAITRELEKR